MPRPEPLLRKRTFHVPICGECGAAQDSDYTESHFSGAHPCPNAGKIWARSYVECVPLESVAAFVGDAQHPDWSAYIAANLAAALDVLKDTGDWHGALRSWCDQNEAGLPPCPMIPVEKSA